MPFRTLVPRIWDDAESTETGASLTAIDNSYKRPAWIEIDLSAIEHNIKEIINYVGAGTEIMVVVKADAYGHGAIEASKRAIASGISRLGVALPEELVALRNAGIDAHVHILSDISLCAASLIVKFDGIPTVNNLKLAKAINMEAGKQKKKIKVHVKIDTGMSRSGVLPEFAVGFLKNLKNYKNIFVEGILTHFATADDPGNTYMRMQMDKFAATCDELEKAGLKPALVHAANSAAAILVPECHFNMVRIGIMAYGLHPCKATRDKIALKPALALKSKIMRIEKIPKGTGVSYGITYMVPEDKKIATLPLGYADGYTRLLSNKSYSIINGQKCRNVGNITMDQMMVELDNDMEVRLYDIATLIGKHREHKITADDIAQTIGTINYEITCMFSKRLPRIYIN